MAIKNVKRTATFETNSSSSHALVVPKCSNKHLSNNKVKYKFKVKTYEFGRNYGVYTDAPHKFAYVWQFLSPKIKMPNLDNLPRNLPKKEYDLKEKELHERFSRLKLLLEVIANWICDQNNVLIDFSDLEIAPEGEMYCSEKIPSDDLFVSNDNGVMLDSALDEHFEFNECAKIINEILDKKDEPIKITEPSPYGNAKNMILIYEKRPMVLCFQKMLDFAFDENSVLLCSDDSSPESDKAEFICEYVEKNKGYCIVSWLC